MVYNPSLDPIRSRNASMSGGARNWYALANADIGAKELPEYGRALRVRIGSGVSLPLVLVVVPVDEANDEVTRTLNIDATEFLPFAVRRIVSVAGGTTIPANVSIDVVTK